MYLSHPQNVITAFEIFVHMWYLLKTIVVVLVNMYVTVLMVAYTITEVSS